jgi:hypothetical protein
LRSATISLRYGKDRAVAAISVNPGADRWQRSLLVKEEHRGEKTFYYLDRSTKYSGATLVKDVSPDD